MFKTYTEMTEQERREVRVYGCTVEQMKEAVTESLAFRFDNVAMYVVSMLSDAQEMAASDVGGQFDLMVIEDQRQLLNRAKWVLNNYARRTVEI